MNFHNDYLTDASDAYYQMKPSLGITIPPRDEFAHPTCHNYSTKMQQVIGYYPPGILILYLLLSSCVPAPITSPILTPTSSTMTRTTEGQTPIRHTVTAPAYTPSPAIPSHVQLLDFELLGVPASYKPIKSHWSLWDLQLWHDRIYLAHSDWSSNTGPMQMIYYDLNTGEVVHDEDFIVDEEALELFRVYYAEWGIICGPIRGKRLSYG